jgi:hypothetical protein
MFENLKEKFNKRLAEGMVELERRRAKKEERLKKKQQSMKRGSISYGLAMHQSPKEVFHAVIEKRRYEREAKKKG